MIDQIQSCDTQSSLLIRCCKLPSGALGQDFTYYNKFDFRRTVNEHGYFNISVDKVTEIMTILAFFFEDVL